MTDKLKALLSRCKCGVHVEVNTHRDVYLSAERWLAENDDAECPLEIAPEVRVKMIETDRVVEVHFYPDTPVGFYRIVHHDLDAALDEALACLAEDAP